jgi:hypothetical protein
MCAYLARRSQLDEIEQLCYRYKQLPAMPINVDKMIGTQMAGDTHVLTILGGALLMQVCVVRACSDIHYCCGQVDKSELHVYSCVGLLLDANLISKRSAGLLAQQLFVDPRLKAYV